MSIGEGIRKRRLELGISQSDLAARVFKARQTITNIEAGRRGVNSRELLMYCSALNTDPNTLFEFNAKKASYDSEALIRDRKNASTSQF